MKDNANLKAWAKQWAQDFASKQLPMDDSTVETYLAACLMPDDVDTKPFEHLFEYQMLKKRCEYLGIASKPSAILFVATIADRPGVLVMYASALAALGRSMTMDGLASTFPMGFPDDEHIRTMWDEQKGYLSGFPSDNTLDLLSAEVFM